MCTLFYAADLGLLSKNRDKETATEELIVSDRNVLGVQTQGDDYFSLCMNSHGVAFASTAVNSPEWTSAIEKGEFDRAREIMNAEREARERPTRYLSQHFSEIRQIEDAVHLLVGANKRWLGYNVLLADGDCAIVVELFDNEIISRRLPSRSAVTNHLVAIRHGASCYSDYPSSYNRLEYAQRKLKAISGLDELQQAIHPASAQDRDAIWREGAFSTVSSAIIDLPNAAIFHTQSITEEFKRYDLR